MRFGRLAALACGVFSALALASGAAATSPGANGQILFGSSTPADHGIYALGVDGTIVQVTHGGADSSASASPDGTRLAYAHASIGAIGSDGFPMRTSDTDIWIANADGTGAVDMTNTPGVDEFAPSWSPDGTRIAYTGTDSVTGEVDVFVLDVATGAVAPLTATPGGTYEFEPRWSPDGTKLAFGRGTFRSDSIWVMNADGSGQTELFANPGWEARYPSWSPDGSRIVFELQDPDPFGAVHLEVMNADGTKPAALTAGTRDSYPAWSPDGTQVAFTRGNAVWTVGVATGAETLRGSVGSGNFVSDWTSSTAFSGPVAGGGKGGGTPPPPTAKDTVPPVVTGTTDRKPNAAGWFNAPVLIHWTAVDPAPSSGGPKQPPPDTLADVEGIGVKYVSATACDVAGNCATGVVKVSLDATAPLVAYSGNAGAYTVDQTVAITCAATDALSGVAATTCADVSGPAYSFALGANTFSATATDVADNVGSATATFTVSVTRPTLCNLTKQFETNAFVAAGLCAVLDRSTTLYVLAVNALVGRGLTAEQAAILTRLANAL